MVKSPKDHEELELEKELQSNATNSDLKYILKELYCDIHLKLIKNYDYPYVIHYQKY